jgi:hypothetical protein
MKSNYPRKEGAPKKQPPSVVWTSILAAVTGCLLQSLSYRERGLGQMFSTELWPYAQYLFGILGAIGAVLTLGALWRGTSWKLPQKATFALLSGVLLISTAILQDLLMFGFTPHILMVFLVVRGVAMYTVEYALVGLLVWGPAMFFEKRKQRRNIPESVESAEVSTTMLNLGSSASTSEENSQTTVRSKS